MFCDNLFPLLWVSEGVCETLLPSWRLFWVFGLHSFAALNFVDMPLLASHMAVPAPGQAGLPAHPCSVPLARLLAGWAGGRRPCPRALASVNVGDFATHFALAKMGTKNHNISKTDKEINRIN